MERNPPRPSPEPPPSRWVRAVVLSMALLAALLAILYACRRDAPPPPAAVSRGDLRLDGKWAAERTAGESGTGTLVWETSFDLEEGRVGAGSELALDGVWWSATVAVNGIELPPVTGGLGVAAVHVGEHLRTGRNELWIAVSPPLSKPSVVTNGTRPHVTMGAPPVLRIRPDSHVDGVVLRPAGSEEVETVVRTRNAPPGSRVRAFALLDGERLQELGSAEVAGNVTTLAGVGWSGPRWRPDHRRGMPLLHVVAVLEDRDGEILDRHSVRTAVRSVTVDQEGFSLDGTRFSLLANRVDQRAATRGILAPAHASPERRTRHATPSSQLARIAVGGINALEIHGTMPLVRWLDEADEIGVPVVYMPRCAGVLWRGDTGQSAAQIARWKDTLWQQDQELVWRLARHPALWSWACEGSLDEAHDICEGLATQDPAARPVLGVDVPVRSIGKDTPTATAWAGERSLHWIAEVGMSHRESEIAELAADFVAASKGGSLGGVGLPPPPQADELAEWAGDWAGVAAAIGAPALPLDRRRASSRVAVSGAVPGSPVWLEATWLTPVGAIADSRGRAKLELWHDGQATVHCGGDQVEVTLRPDEWRDLQRTDQATDVDLPPRP